jgi:hypothetical protein
MPRLRHLSAGLLTFRTSGSSSLPLSLSLFSELSVSSAPLLRLPPQSLLPRLPLSVSLLASSDPPLSDSPLSSVSDWSASGVSLPVLLLLSSSLVSSSTSDSAVTFAAVSLLAQADHPPPPDPVFFARPPPLRRRRLDKAGIPIWPELLLLPLVERVASQNPTLARQPQHSTLVHAEERPLSASLQATTLLLRRTCAHQTTLGFGEHHWYKQPKARTASSVSGSCCPQRQTISLQSHSRPLGLLQKGASEGELKLTGSPLARSLLLRQTADVDNHPLSTGQRYSFAGCPRARSSHLGRMNEKVLD